MTLAWFDLGERTMEWTGVGNVEARFVRAGAGPDARHDSPVVLGGVVGFNLPQVRMQTIALEPGDAVVLATDGVAADFSVSLESGVRRPAARRARARAPRQGHRRRARRRRALPRPAGGGLPANVNPAGWGSVAAVRVHVHVGVPRDVMHAR